MVLHVCLNFMGKLRRFDLYYIKYTWVNYETAEYNLPSDMSFELNGFCGYFVILIFNVKYMVSWWICLFIFIK